MRALHIADPHVLLAGPRAAECRRIIDWVATNAREVKPDVIIIAGDSYDRRSTPQERLFFAEFLRSLSDVAPVFLIRGNHDDIDDLKLFRKEYGWSMRAEIILDPAVFTWAGMTLAFLPWPDLGSITAKAGATDSIATKLEVARSAMIDVLRGFSTNPGIGPDKPSLLIAHLPVNGASMDSGQPVCGGYEISLTADELLESGAAGVALGHIHLRQQMKGMDGRPVFYAGAPFRGSFGEARGTKGGLIWDWIDGAWLASPWEVPARAMVLIERTWLPAEDGALEAPVEPLAAEDDVRGADVRIRISFPAESREAMRAAMAPAIDAVKAVANSVAVEEPPLIVSRTRCAEITAARTTIDKLRAWAQSVGAEVPAGAEVKLNVLEEAARAN
jgi:DNA repair exonuclease SbcCD nuclease subunit